MKKWKMIFTISIVLTIIFMVLCSVLNADNTRGIWQIMKALFFIASVVDIISIIGCIVTSVKNKEKMPIWLIIIIVVIVSIGVVAFIGNMANNEYEQNAKDYADRYSLKTPSDIGGSKLTMNKFESIENGLTYNQVCDIIGFQGTLSEETGSVKQYKWEENGKVIQVMFLNNKSMSKGQSGL